MSEPRAHHLPLPGDAEPPVRYLFTGPPWRTMHMDAGIAEMWGRSRAQLYRDPRIWLDSINEEDRSRLLEAWGGEPYQRWDLVYRVMRPDGAVVRVRDQGFRLPSRGPGLQVSGRVSEVTAQYELEERLRFHAQLFDALEQSVVATNDQGRVVFWNRAAEQLFGWTAEEAMGQPIHELVGVFLSSGELEVRRRDRALIVVETRASPVLDADREVVGQIVISSDISERKRAERRLRESEERFRAIFARAGIGIAIT